MPSTASADFTPRPATDADAAHVAELWNHRTEARRGVRPHTEDDVRKRWKTLGFSLPTDSLLAFDKHGKLVGYAHVMDVKDPPVDVFAGHAADPTVEDPESLWQVLLDWVERRAREAIPRAPEGTRVCLVAGGGESETALLRRFEARGFAHTRTFSAMRIGFDPPLAVPQWPQGVSVRCMCHGKDDEALVGAYREAFKDHYGYIEQPFERELARWRGWMGEDDFDPTLWFLAVEGDEVCGYCCCYASAHGDDGAGLIDELGVRPAWRRRGIASALLHHAFIEMDQRGLHGATLNVDSKSNTGADRLYERAGMAAVRRSHTYVKELRAGVNLVTE